MEAVAKAKFLRGSARKMRLVADIVRGKDLVWATTHLKFMPQVAARRLQKILEAAAANAIAIEGTAKLKPEDLRIARLMVDGGPIARRFRAVGMGRAYRIRKRYCHVTVIVSDDDARARAEKKAEAKTHEKEVAKAARRVSRKSREA